MPVRTFVVVAIAIELALFAIAFGLGWWARGFQAGAGDAEAIECARKDRFVLLDNLRADADDTPPAGLIAAPVVLRDPQPLYEEGKPSPYSDPKRGSEPGVHRKYDDDPNGTW